MGVPSFALKKPVMTLMLYSALLMLGIISLLRLQVELYQGQNQGIISIIVRARGGLPPVEVEKQITKPIEESVATVDRLKSLYSNSREAESRVTMEFEPGTDMQFAALEIREKFARVKPHLPKEIEKPVIANYDDTQAAILTFAITSDSKTPQEVREIVEAELQTAITRIDGVASVEVYGGQARKILVELDRDKMVAYNISIEKVMDILGQSNVNLLAGDVPSGKLELAIRTMGAFENVEEIGELGIQATRQGSIIPLKEIGTIKDSYMEPEDNARLNLEQNVTIYVKKTSIAKTIPLVKTLRKLLKDFEMRFKEELDIVIVADKAEIIERSIKDVRDALYVGMVLIVAIIYLFLRNWILALIVFLAVPCSVVTTFLVMSFLNISINVMTLSGLALSIGIMVDSAVVVIENIFSKKEKGFTDARAIREGAEEVWLPLLGSLVTSLIVFLPVIFIDKKIQLTFSGFAFTVCASLTLSFFVALMLVPVLMRWWAVGRLDKEVESVTTGVYARLQDGYRWIMDWNFRFRYPIVAVLLGLFAIASLSIHKKDIDWPNTLEENEFSVIIFPLAGARLEANDDAVRRVEEILNAIPDVTMVSSTIQKQDVRIFVRLKPPKERQYAKEEIMNIVDQRGNELIKEIHDDYSLIIDEGAASGEQKKLVINIFGHENDVLQKLAVEAANRMSAVPGYINLVMTDLRKRPEYSLVVDKGRAAVYGLSVRDVADSIHAQVRGMRPTKFHEVTTGEEIETITRLQAIYRQKLEDLKFVHMATDSGNQIPLGEISNFYPSVGPQTIDRKDKYRYVFVKGDTKRPMEAIAKDVKVALREMKFPDEYYWRFGGSYEELIKGKSQLGMAFILTVFLVYMVLACLFQNYIEPLLVMISVPMASIGIWLALTLTGKSLSQNVFIGMILLAGYVVNAAIILMDHFNHLKASGMGQYDALVQAGLDRLRPILMTTLSTVLGFLPMALSLGQSSDLWSPLAVTVIGGLLSSTILTLFVLPNFIVIAYEWIDAFKKIGANLSNFKFKPSIGE